MPSKIKDEDKLEGLSDVVDLSNFPRHVADELSFVKGNMDHIMFMFENKCGTKAALKDQMNYIMLHAIMVGVKYQQDKDYAHMMKLVDKHDRLEANMKSLLPVTSELVQLLDDYDVPITKAAKVLHTSVARLRSIK